MLHEASRIQNLAVFTRQGTRLGVVHDLLLDITGRRVAGLYITGTNPNLVPEGVPVLIPYRWVQDLDDVVLLRYFPTDIDLSPVEAEAMEIEILGDAEPVEALELPEA